MALHLMEKSDRIRYNFIRWLRQGWIFCER